MRQAHCPVYETSTAALGCPGTPRAAQPRTPAPRPRRPGSGPPCRGVGTTAIDRPMIRWIRGTHRPGRRVFTAVGTHADHHQQTQLLLLEPDFEVDAVDPEVDIIAGDVAVVEGGRFLLPLAGQSVIVAADNPAPEPRNCSSAGPKSPDDNPCRYSSGNTALTSGFTCPGRDDPRREPLAFTSFRVDPFVVDPGARTEPHRRRSSPPAGCGSRYAPPAGAHPHRESPRRVRRLCSLGRMESCQEVGRRGTRPRCVSGDPDGR